MVQYAVTPLSPGRHIPPSRPGWPLARPTDLYPSLGHSRGSITYGVALLGTRTVEISSQTPPPPLVLLVAPRASAPGQDPAGFCCASTRHDKVLTHVTGMLHPWPRLLSDEVGVGPAAPIAVDGPGSGPTFPTTEIFSDLITPVSWRSPAPHEPLGPETKRFLLPLHPYSRISARIRHPKGQTDPHGPHLAEYSSWVLQARHSPRGCRCVTLGG